MRVLSFETSRDAYLGIIDCFLKNKDGLIDGRSGLRVWSFDVTIEIGAPDLATDLTRVGFSARRWRTFLQHYFEPRGFSTFYQRIVHSRKAQEVGYSCPVRAPHTMGNCLYGLSVHREPFRISLYSRACVWAPTGLLDLSIASALAISLQQDMGCGPAKIVWHVGQLQMNSVKSFPILANLGLLEDAVAGKYSSSLFGKMVQSEYSRIDQKMSSPYKTYQRYAKKTKAILGGHSSAPFTPYIPDEYRFACLDQLPGYVTLENIAEVTGMPLERVKWSARQMGLPFRDFAATWPIEDPKIQALITALMHRKEMRGVGG